MLEVLDFCDTARSTARRNVTSVPTQALTLLNGDFVNRQARQLANRLERDAGPDPAAQIDRAYFAFADRLATRNDRHLRFLEREAGVGSPTRPTVVLKAEGSHRPVQLAESFDTKSWSNRTIVPTQARHEALVQLCRAIFNTNEFVYPD